MNSDNEDFEEDFEIDSSDEEEEIVCAAIIVAAALNEEKRNTTKRQNWTDVWLSKQKTENKEKFTDFSLKSDIFKQSTFQILLEKVRPFIEKQDTLLRTAIPVAARLQATLLYLISGLSYAQLQIYTKISSSSLCSIIPETCNALYVSLKDEYLKTPMEAEEWREVAKGFENKWQFPNCIGAIDGKHIEIKPPPGEASEYYNYKGTHSIILMAIANANYEFIYMDVSTKGNIFDESVWGSCELSDLLEADKMGLPGPMILKNSTKCLPHVFVADNYFPLKTYLLRPFPIRERDGEQNVFSYRLSRARLIVENALGIMASQFRVLNAPISLSPKKAQVVVLACATLHNLLQRLVPEEYQHPGSVDEENEETGRVYQGTWRNQTSLISLGASRSRNSVTESKNTREQFCHYFNNEGQVTWQRRMIGLE